MTEKEFEELKKDMEEFKKTNPNLANKLLPFIRGVVDFLSDENVDELSIVQLVSKIGEHLNKN